MPKKLKEVLVEAGIPMDFESGGHSPAALTDREVNREPHARVKKLKEVFMQTLSSANNEFPYWYSREYFQNDSEIPVVRRAKALKAAFSHLTPVIYPGELLVMRKASYFRGSFPMPWLSEGYYMAKEDELYQDALKRGSASADEHSKFGTGGGNVTKSFGKVVSLAGKFGMRQEEVPALLKLAKKWVGKSVDDLGHKYEQMVPDYAVKEALMRNVICMFDSGYTLPQGREVINYYYPLEYGFDDHVGVGDGCGEIKCRRDECNDAIARFGRQASLVDLRVVDATNGRHPAVEPFALRIDERDGHASVREAHRNACAHRACADHGGLADFARLHLGRKTGDFRGLAFGEEVVTQRFRLRAREQFEEASALEFAACFERQRGRRFAAIDDTQLALVARRALVNIGAKAGEQVGGRRRHARGQRARATQRHACRDQLARIGQRVFQQIAVRQRIDEPEVERLLRAHGRAAQHHGRRMFHRHQTGETLRAAGARQKAEFHLG